jgi:SNF2 family DNA or RNA helicase
VVGSAKERAAQYANECFFTICNYEQILRDANAVHHVPWDLIILDEAQRIKNWEAKTTRAVKALRSPYALVLTGTPMENRLEELYSVVEFVDDTRLGPAFRFINTYRMADEKGRVLGYKNLDLIRDKMKPLLLRRTRQNVMQDLPPRTTEVVRITPSQQQLEMHDGHKRVISSIINKKYFTEMDFLRLQKAMLMCRMIADSTYLADKLTPSYSTKLEELDNLLQRLNREDDRKIVLFSEWTTMLNLIEPILTKHKMSFVRLDGSVPQKKRQALVNRFQSDPACKLFITTNAGSTGLNLQAGNTVINVDLPWNPAILEQRISRVHRMGQKRPIQVYLLVTTETLEEGLLGTLSAKHELAKAALDIDSNITEVSLQSGLEELKRRLEVLLGQQPDAAEVLQDTAEMEKQKKERKERIAAAGGQLLTAAFMFMGEMMPQPRDSEKVSQMASAFKNTLEDCFETDEAGQVKMTVKFANMQVVEQLSQTLARLAVAGQG